MDEILLYRTPNDDIRLEVFIRDETIWLTQKQIADLFRVKIPAISKHIKNICESGCFQIGNSSRYGDAR